MQDDVGAFAMPAEGDAELETDPAAAVEQAAADGTLVAERDQGPTPDEIRASVQRWWKRTEETADFKDAVQQTDRDVASLEAGSAEDKADASKVTVNHIYRNALQTVAMTVPNDHSVSFEAREMVEGLPGEAVDAAVTALKRQATGLGQVLSILDRRYTEEINLQETVEAFVQDASHFRMAILKVAWQSSFEDDMITGERLPDEQDNMARLRGLIEQYQRGEFTKNDYQWHDIRSLMQQMGKVEIAVRTGLVIEEVPIDQFRVDPMVTGPENIYSAAWMRHDILMTRQDVLDKWPEIDPDDLGRAFVYSLDESGKRVKDEAAARAEGGNQAQMPAGSNTRTIRDQDLLLVAEIHDATTNTVRVLVEGLDYYAAEYQPEMAVDGFFPFVVLVLNRMPKRLYGKSDTELQAKSQDAINRMRSGEESAREAAQPRFVYDTNQIDADDAKRIACTQPWEATGLDMGGKDIRQAMMALMGNHEFSAQEYDTTKHQDEMRRMVALPEEATGGVGGAEFSSQVQVAAAGATVMVKYRQGRINRALQRLHHMIAQHLLFRVGPDTAVKMAGPMAAKYWPATPPDRQTIYQWLDVKVKTAVDGQLDSVKRADTLAKVFDAAGRMGVRMPANSGVKLLAKVMGEDEAADLFTPDPNALVGDLAQSLQTQGGQLAPEAVLMLVQLGEMAKQQAMQMAAQAAATGAQPGQEQQPPPPAAPSGQPPAP